MRAAISKRLRFEIFHRDGFKCRYCGRAVSDEVRLEVDHIEPVARGGQNNAENLITACHDCNAGKRDKPLNRPVADPLEHLARNQEIQEQLEAVEAAKAARSADVAFRQSIVNYVCELFQRPEFDRRSIMVFVSLAKQHGAEELFRWLDITEAKFGCRAHDTKICKYVCGIRRQLHKANTVEGEVHA